MGTTRSAQGHGPLSVQVWALERFIAKSGCRGCGNPPAFGIHGRLCAYLREEASLMPHEDHTWVATWARHTSGCIVGGAPSVFRISALARCMSAYGPARTCHQFAIKTRLFGSVLQSRE